MNATRLHPASLARLSPAVRRPRYRREAHGVGIVHLGLGAFHRAHQASHFDELLDRAGGDWRICGVSCRSASVREQLLPQECLYTVAERDAAGTRYRLVQSLAAVLVAPDDPAAVIATIARPSTRLISMTVTEKGYCRSPATGRLDIEHDDIVHDLRDPVRPRSAIGLLVAGLRARRQASVAAPTVLCCDNLPNNGAALRRIVVDLAGRLDPGLADWIERGVAFPSSMVDRLVPATTAADIAEAESETGLRDLALVVTEPFTQWVIEDRFAGARPALDLTGVQWVRDVRPFEIAKLRLLNGSHSSLAYLGLAAGYRMVHEAMADSDLRPFIEMLMRDELAPTLVPTEGLDLAAYQHRLLARFGNSALRHALGQIAMDGSQKLPQRLLAPLRQRLEAGQSASLILLVIAAWILYAAGLGEGAPHTVDDPLAARFAEIASRESGSAAGLAEGFLGMREIFGADLPESPGFSRQLTNEIAGIMQCGVRARVRAVLREAPNG